MKPRLNFHPKYPLKVNVWVGIRTKGATDVCTFLLYCEILQTTLVHYSQKSFISHDTLVYSRQQSKTCFLNGLNHLFGKRDKLVPNATGITWYESHQKHLAWAQKIHMVWSRWSLLPKINLQRVVVNFCLP